LLRVLPDEINEARLGCVFRHAVIANLFRALLSICGKRALRRPPA
jgi:hypothetical protein